MLTTLSTYDREGNPRAQRVAFEFPEAVINAYLMVSLQRQPRPGIESASVRLLPGNHLTVEARLNFDDIADKLSKAAAETWKGVRPATVELSFDVSNAHVKLKCDRLVVDGKALPAGTAKEVIQAIAALQPEKYDTTRPIPLPYGLKRLSTAAGTVTADTGH